MNANFMFFPARLCLIAAAFATQVCFGADAGPGAEQPPKVVRPTLTREEAEARIEAQRRRLENGGKDARSMGGAMPSTGPVFNLDFRGGRPQELVAAIVNATGEPLNVVIPVEDADVPIPPVKVQKVTVEDLFSALAVASKRTVAQVTGTYFSDFGGKGRRAQYTMVNTSYSFEKKGNVWIFHAEKAVPIPSDEDHSGRMVARFFQLEPYLTNYTVDDIITAIQTAWELSNKGNEHPTLKFHKETKLLIAAGEESQLRVIEDALTALRPDLSSARVVKPSKSTNSTTAATAENSNKP